MTLRVENVWGAVAARLLPFDVIRVSLPVMRCVATNYSVGKVCMTSWEG